MNRDLNFLWQDQAILETSELTKLLQDPDELVRRIAWLRLPENPKAFPTQEYGKIFSRETLVVQGAMIEVMQALVNLGTLGLRECEGWFSALISALALPGVQPTSFLSLNILKSFFGIRALQPESVLRFYESCKGGGVEFLAVFFHHLAKRPYLLKDPGIQRLILERFQFFKAGFMEEAVEGLCQELLICGARSNQVEIFHAELKSMSLSSLPDKTNQILSRYREILAREIALSVTQQAYEPIKIFDFDEHFLRLILNFLKPVKWSLKYWKEVLALGMHPDTAKANLLMDFLRVQAWLFRDVLMNLLEQELKPELQLQLLRLLQGSLQNKNISGRRIPFEILFSLLRNATTVKNLEMAQTILAILNLDRPKSSEVLHFSKWVFDEIGLSGPLFVRAAACLNHWSSHEVARG